MRRSKNTFPCVTNIENICQCYEKKPQEIYMRLKNDDVTKKAHMIKTWNFLTISSNRKNIGKE